MSGPSGGTGRLEEVGGAAGDVWYVGRVPTDGAGIGDDTSANWNNIGVAKGGGTSGGSATVVKVDEEATGVIRKRD